MHATNRMCARYQFIKPLAPHKMAKMKSCFTHTGTLQNTQQDLNLIFLYYIDSLLAS